jgi:hypothetical protein
MAFPATFLDMQGDVLDKGRLDASADTDRVKDWLNSSYYQACIETNFYETAAIPSVPLAVNAMSVAVPAAVVKVEYVVSAGVDGMPWGPMRQITFEEILELRAYSQATQSLGAPDRYAYRGSGSPSIEFWPQASGGEVITFYGTTFPPLLVNDGDLSIFPPPYEAVIMYGALVEASEFQKDILTQQGWNAAFQDWLTRLRALVNVRPGSKVQQFRIAGARQNYPRNNSVDTGY